MRTLAKRLLRAVPALYGESKWAEVRLRYALRIPHEPDFLAFRNLAEYGLFVDIGANAGQSALSFAAVRPGWRILSFEPNPAVGKYLDRVSRVLGERYSWRNIGLGASSGRLTFHVPVHGGLEATQEGSFKRDALDTPSALGRAGVPDEIRSIEVAVEPLDALALSPDVVKIDVQGFEHEVLEGMRNTLAARPPRALYVEYGPDSPRVAAYLQGFGYTASYWDGKALVDWSGSACGNLIFRR